MTISTTTGAEARPRKSGLPMALTIARMALAPVIAALILAAAYAVHTDPLLAGFLYGAAAALFALAALSDWLDGWLARKLGAVSPLGAALDHCADKVLLTCVLIALAYASLPLELVAAAVLMLGRDVAVSGLREGMSSAGRTLPVDGWGKWKAAAAMAGVTSYLVYQTLALLPLASAQMALGLFLAARVLIWLATALALISGARYALAARL